MAAIVYIRMKQRVSVKENATIILKDIAHISTQSADKEFISCLPLYQIKQADQTLIVDSYHVIEHISTHFPSYEYELIGENETIIDIIPESKKHFTGLVVLVWFILFIGTAMTIVNFHEDVSMLEVHERLHYLFTGEKNGSLLFIQIPYSIGLGVGMIVFLNHWFKKRINDEPSPLELELFKYQKDINQYVAYYENPLNKDEHRH